jgi:myo-inositol-1(or 4)-monophosphatase
MVHKNLDMVGIISPIIRQAGAIVLSYFNRPLVCSDKGEDKGFVTQADLASEQYLIEQLAPIIPGAAFIAEESGEQCGAASDYCWVIDPLDGTTNFAHGIPYFCISIALTYKQEPVFGMIFQPITHELFYATKGQGAMGSEGKVQVTAQPISQAIIALGLPYAKDDQYASLLAASAAVARECYAIRHFGAVALDAAYVACGKLGGMFFERLEWWDIAAGVVLIQEAGGTITNFEGKKLNRAYESCVAGAPKIHQRLQELVK